MKRYIFNFLILVVLYFGNSFITNYNYYFFLIYTSLFLYHLYFFYFFVKRGHLKKNEIKIFLTTSILLFLITYFVICDPNPFSILFFYYTFNPCFIKAILIIIIHTSFLDNYKKHYINNFIILNSNKIINFKVFHDSYFLSDWIKYIKRNTFSIIFFTFILILFFSFDALIFVNRIKIWVYFNKKNKTLPNSYSKNTTFYITSTLVNVEKIIESYIEEMKKLIEYLGESNVILSIVENGDSKDNTRQYLKSFQNFLNKKGILNKFYMKNEINDPRKNGKYYFKLSPLRIEYYAKLRNKCLEFLYEQNNLDFDNVIVIFFNDVVFSYEDIINLLSTNNEDFDAVCGLDMEYHFFYDVWVTIDLDGNGLSESFPFFMNKEAQDLVIYHKPIRVFSCWNGVIAFKASPLKYKNFKFRHKVNTTLPKYILNVPIKKYYNSECTYFHIDLFSLGYTKKFINPDVRVAYKNEGYFTAKYLIPHKRHICKYFKLYFLNFLRKRNKSMSDLGKNITFKPILKNWYLENKIKIK